MKKLVTVGLLLGGMMQAVPALALVRLVASCTTSDGKYQISITDNQGIGRVRTSHFGASVRDSDNRVVASYSLVFVPAGLGPTSFKHASYVDAQTRGQKFNFAYPSTNTPYAVSALLSDGSEIHYGQRFTPSEGELNCTAH